MQETIKTNKNDKKQSKIHDKTIKIIQKSYFIPLYDSFYSLIIHKSKLSDQPLKIKYVNIFVNMKKDFYYFRQSMLGKTKCFF